jgi:zinc protease
MVNSFIAKKDLDTEMTVVRNEMENGENNPTRILQSECSRQRSYGITTAIQRSVHDQTWRMCRSSALQAFYRTYYQPDNAVLVVAGKFDEAKTLAHPGEVWSIAEAIASLPNFIPRNRFRMASAKLRYIGLDRSKSLGGVSRHLPRTLMQPHSIFLRMS